MPSARARRLCPDLVFLHSNFALYRRVSAEVFAIFREFTPLVQVVSIDEAYLDVTDHLDPGGSATAVAIEIRRRVLARLHLTVSIGVGPNKLIAKIASDFNKPDGLTVVKPSQVQAFLDPLPVRKLRGVGPATEARIVDLGFHTVRHLRQAESVELERRFGRFGTVLHRFANGKDDRPVSTERKRKSLSCERTFSQDLRDRERMLEELSKLSEKVAAGLEKRDLTARTLSIKVRYPNFETITRARTLVQPTASVRQIGNIVAELYDRSDAVNRGVRLLGVTASGLISEDPPESPQLSLFDDST